MTKQFFESKYGYLAHSEDARKALGPFITEGTKTVGDIHKAFEGHPGDASVYLENDGRSFYVTDFHGEFFCG
jgi:hypothetical protein